MVRSVGILFFLLACFGALCVFLFKLNSLCAHDIYVFDLLVFQNEYWEESIK